MRHHRDTTNRGNRYIICAAILTLTMALSPAVQAQDFIAPKVKVGGHFDVQSVVNDNRLSTHEFRIGQLGLRVSSEINRRVSATAELAYDRNDQIVVDEAFIDYAFFKRQRRFIRPRTAGLMHVGMRVGQFDVPFGIDWKSYSSFKRPLITMPLVVINTHRGWNDIGGLFTGSTTWSNWAVWVVNGFGQSPKLRCPERHRVPPVSQRASTASAPLDIPGDSEYPESPVDEAFGLRAAIQINEVFEIGTSFAAGYTDDNVQDEKLIGFDFTAIYEEFEFKTEFIRQERYRTTDYEEVVFGYYLQMLYAEEQFFGVIRLDAYEPDNSEIYPLGITTDETTFSGSFGAGLKITPEAQLRAEYRLSEGSHNDRAVIQAVVGF